MLKMFCNRCKEEIKGTTYYTVNIYAEDINPTAITKSHTTAMHNINENMAIAFSQKKHYCEKCKNEIEKFIGRK